MPSTRPVWLTREQRDAIENMLEAFFDLNHVGNVVEQWDAAPADAAGKVIAWFDAQFDLDDEAEDLAASVKSLLRALGMPDA